MSCPVWYRAALIRELEKVANIKRVDKKFNEQMEVFKKIGGRGLVHSRRSDVDWIKLGKVRISL